jgi:hypothetical protein
MAGHGLPVRIPEEWIEVDHGRQRKLVV